MKKILYHSRSLLLMTLAILMFSLTACNTLSTETTKTSKTAATEVDEVWEPPTKSPIPFVKIIQTVSGEFPPNKWTLDEREKIPVKFHIYETPGEDGWYHLSEPYTEAEGTIKIKGQGTAGYDKRSFSINLGKENAIPIMGMPKSHKWAIKSNYVDVTHLANRMAYDLYRDMGHYGVPGQYVQVYFERLSSEMPLPHSGYWGLYSFELKVQHGRDMVNTPKKKDGGFIVKLNNTEQPKQKFETLMERIFEYEYPNFDDVTDSQKIHIQNTLNRYEQAVMDRQDWRRYMDEDAETDYFIIVDAFINPDSYWINKNLFYFLNQEGKIEPVIWDFDWAYGPPFYVDYGNQPWTNLYKHHELIYGKEHCGESINRWLCFPLMKYYIKDVQNVENYRQRYRNWRTGKNGFEPLLSDARMKARLDELIKPLMKGRVYFHDYQRWKYKKKRYCAISKFNFPYCNRYFEDEMLNRFYQMDKRVTALRPRLEEEVEN